MEHKKDIEKLLEELKKLGWGRKEIEEEFTYKHNYISQALSRGGNEKLLSNLQKLLKRVKGATTEEYDAGEAIREIRAISEVTLAAVAEILAKTTGQSATVVKDQLEELVKKRRNTSELEL